MEGQSADGNAEECVPAQHFHVPILEVEGLMRDHCRRVDGNVVVRSISNRGADGTLIIGSIRNREVR